MGGFIAYVIIPTEYYQHMSQDEFLHAGCTYLCEGDRILGKHYIPKKYKTKDYMVCGFSGRDCYTEVLTDYKLRKSLDKLFIEFVKAIKYVNRARGRDTLQEDDGESG